MKYIPLEHYRPQGLSIICYISAEAPVIQKCLLMILGFVLSAQASDDIFDSNLPKDTKIQIQNDLKFMYSLEGQKQSDFHLKIFGPFGGKSYKKFFEDHIWQITIGDCGGNAMACVFKRYDKKMYLDKNYIKLSHPQIARLMVLFHEARHTEEGKDFWTHDECPNPFFDESGREILSIWTGSPLSGEPACDSAAFGSYGSSTILLKNISQFCTNCSDKVKMDADIYAMDQLIRIPQADIKKSILQDFKR